MSRLRQRKRSDKARGEGWFGPLELLWQEKRWKVRLLSRGDVRRSGRGGDDSATSPGKTELQSLHRNPQERLRATACFACL